MEESIKLANQIMTDLKTSQTVKNNYKTKYLKQARNHATLLQHLDRKFDNNDDYRLSDLVKYINGLIKGKYAMNHVTDLINEFKRSFIILELNVEKETFELKDEDIAKHMPTEELIQKYLTEKYGQDYKYLVIEGSFFNDNNFDLGTYNHIIPISYDDEKLCMNLYQVDLSDPKVQTVLDQLK